MFLLILLAAVSMIGLGWFWMPMTRARFLGFAAYIILGEGGTATQSAILSCKAYLDSDPTSISQARLRCSSKVVEVLLKAVASAIAGGFVEDAVSEYFLRVVGRAR
jgi:hypothetical protein